MDEYLFELFVGQRDGKSSLLSQLYQLQLELFGEFWFDHSEVCKSLSSFRRQHAPHQCLFLGFQLLLCLGLSLLISHLPLQG